MTSLIKRNSTIPKKETKVFTTGGQPGLLVPVDQSSSTSSNTPVQLNNTHLSTQSGLSSVLIQVYEGERTMTKNNNLLGKFELTGIPPAPRGVPRIEVTFDMDRNGILNVSAADSTGRENKITIINDKGRLSAEEIERMAKEAEQYKADDDKQRERNQAKEDLENFALEMKSILEEVVFKCQEAVFKCQEVINWVDTNEMAEKEEYDERLKRLKEACKPISAHTTHHLSS